MERLPLRQVRLGLLALALAAGASHAAASAAAAAAGGRMMPPTRLSCDSRDGLTSYFGHVVAYRRSAKQAWLRIATDYGTTEEVSVPLAGAGDTSHFLLHGAAFTAKDWPAIESKPGVLRKGTRATAWVCLGSKNPPLVDWNGATE